MLLNISRPIENSNLNMRLFFGSILLIGAYLIVQTIFISNSNLSAETIKFVLIPGTMIGTLVMLLGSLGFSIANSSMGAADQTKFENALPIVVGIGISLGTGVGTSVGLMFGSLALGMAFGSLAGIGIAMTVWKLLRGRDT